MQLQKATPARAEWNITLHVVLIASRSEDWNNLYQQWTQIQTLIPIVSMKSGGLNNLKEIPLQIWGLDFINYEK